MSLLSELVKIYKANPYRDASGRFTSESNAVSISKPKAHHSESTKNTFKNARSKKAKQLLESRAANKKPKEYIKDNSEKVRSEVERLKKLGEKRRNESNSRGADENLKRMAKYSFKTGKDQWGYQDEWNNDPRRQGESDLWYRSVGKSIARNERKTGNQYALDRDMPSVKFTKAYNKRSSHNVFGGENPNLLTNEQIKQYGSKAKAARANLEEYEQNIPKYKREEIEANKKRSDATAKRLGRAYKSELLAELVDIYSPRKYDLILKKQIESKESVVMIGSDGKPTNLELNEQMTDGVDDSDLRMESVNDAVKKGMTLEEAKFIFGVE